MCNLADVTSKASLLYRFTHSLNESKDFSWFSRISSRRNVDNTDGIGENEDSVVITAYQHVMALPIHF